MGACWLLREAIVRTGRTRFVSCVLIVGERLSNKRMKLSVALAPAPRDTEEGHSACSPFGEHRAPAAYARCSTDERKAEDGMPRGVFAHHRHRGCGRGEPGFANSAGVALVEAWSLPRRLWHVSTNGDAFAKRAVSIARRRRATSGTSVRHVRRLVARADA